MFVLMLLLGACASEPPTGAAGATESETAQAAAHPDGPEATPMRQPLVEPLHGPPGTALLLAQVVLDRDGAGKPMLAPARLDIYRPGDGGAWVRTRLEDADSNVFHKALVHRGTVLTIGAEAALLKRWTPSSDGWTQQTLWTGDWSGRYDRLRDAELGDLFGNGHDAMVIATHDQGVVAIVDLDDPQAPVVELGETPDTFIHEIELGDLDGDGRDEIYATPSGRNQAAASQAGGILRYRQDAQGWQPRWIAAAQDTHAKEILVTDLDGDGRDELYGVFAAVRGPGGEQTTPTRVLRYREDAAGEVKGDVIATLDDQDARFLVAGDFDHDGHAELALGGTKTGLYHLVPPPTGAAADADWQLTLIDADSSGFEHALLATDIDGDGRVELIVSSDDQDELRRYDLDPASGAWSHQVIAPLGIDGRRITWNMTVGWL